MDGGHEESSRIVNGLDDRGTQAWPRTRGLRRRVAEKNLRETAK